LYTFKNFLRKNEILDCAI